MINEKGDSNQIRNRIIWTFVSSLCLMLVFGFIILNLSFKATKSLEDIAALKDHTITNADIAYAANSTHAIARGTFLFLSVGIVLFSWLIFNLMFAIIPALRRIAHGVRQVTEGDFEYRVDLPVENEFGGIAKAFNLALDKVVDSEHSLAKEKANVDQLVELRTKQLEEEKARFLASINSMPLGFILLDAQSKVLMLNPSIKHMLKLDELDMAAMADMIHSDKSIVRQIINKAEATDDSGGTISLELTSGEGRSLRTLIAPVLTGDQKSGSVILVEDVTEAKNLERSKDEFFSIASHELRTPLTAIRGNTSMIKQFYGDQLKTEGLGTMVDDIHTSSIQLIEIVNDFLDVGRLEQGKMKFELKDFDLGEMIEEVVKEMKSLSSEKNIDIKIDFDVTKPLMVNGDPGKVRQVVYNLIGNSMKFTEKGYVSIKDEILPDKTVKIFVSDTGRGISTEGKQLLFHKFQQTGNNLFTRDTSKGTGLGLYISKLIIESLGGKIKLEQSEENKGSTFSFTLPVARPDSQKA